MSELRFDGRTAIVTGAARGVGRAHAKLLASRGAKVVIADYGAGTEGQTPSAGPADEVAAEIKAEGGEAVACYASVAEQAGAKRIIETAMDAFGGIDIVINNAGISIPEDFSDETPEKFQLMANIHFLGTMYVTAAAWPHLKKSSAGRVVNTSSRAWVGIHKTATVYGAMKGGVFAFTRCLAADQADTGILVNAIAPRASTRMATAADLAKVFGVPEAAMAGQNMPPELVAPIAAYLSHESCKLNGELFAVGAGQVQRIVLSTAPGIYSADLSPEYIADNLAQLLDTTGAQQVDVLSAHNLVQQMMSGAGANA